MSLNVSIIFEAVNKISSTVRGVTASVRAITRANADNAAAATAATQATDRQARSLRAVEAATQSLTAAKGRLHEGMMKVAAMNLAGDQVSRFGRAVAAPLREGVRTAATFEKSMSGVRAVTRATDADFASLQKTARDLGATTQFSASEAAEGMRFLGMAGLDTQQIMAAMPSMLDMALASDIDLGTAADIGSNILSGFRLPAEEMRRVADVLSLTAASSNVDIRMMGESMKYAAPIASQLGVSLEEVAAMAGFLGNVGIQGSMAGTAIRNMMSRLARTSGPVADKIAALGIEVTDLNGQLLPMPEVLRNVLEGTAELSDLERTGLFMEIFGERAGGAVAELAASGAGLEDFIELLKGAEGSAADMAAVMSDNLHGATKGLESALESLRITVGNRLVPIIRRITTTVTALTRWFDALAARQPVLTSGLVILTGALAAAALVGGLLIKAAAGIVGTITVFKFAVASTGPVLTLLAYKWIPAAILAVKGLGAALLLTPVGWILGGIALIAASAWWLHRNWDTVADAWHLLWNDFPGAVALAYDRLHNILRWVPAWHVWQANVAAWQWGLDRIRALAGGIDPILARLRGLWDGFKESLAGVWTFIQEIFSGMLAGFGGIADRIESTIGRIARFTRRRASSSDAPDTAAAEGTVASLAAGVGEGDFSAPQTITLNAPITIHAAPGADAAGIAAQVRSQFEALLREMTREQLAAAAGALYDPA